MEGSTTTLASFIEVLGTIFDALLGWLGDVFSFMIEQPILAIGVGVTIFGIIIAVAIGTFKRM